MAPKKGKKSADARDELPLENGTFYFPNGDEYTGQYCKGSDFIERMGQGIHKDHEGVVYEGFWEKDKLTGKGRILYPSGAIYEGDLERNQYQGHGRYIWPDGSYYEGYFENNHLQGEGCYTDYNGQVWTGKFHGSAAPGLSFKLNL